MKALLTRTSDWSDHNTTIEINTLEELKELIIKERYPVIVGIPALRKQNGVDLKIEIYDDRRE